MNVVNIDPYNINKLPDFINYRIAKWDEIITNQNKNTFNSKIIIITLANTKISLEGESYKTTSWDIMKQKSELFDEIFISHAIVAKVNGILWDLNRPLETDTTLEIYTFNNIEAQQVFWHSSAHVLGQAIEYYYKDARLCTGPSLKEGSGFYYDVYLDSNQRVHPLKDFKELEKIMNQIIGSKNQHNQNKKKDQKEIHSSFLRLELTKEEALDMFQDNKFKIEVIQSKILDGKTCTAYRCGSFIDLCKGPHLPQTGMIKAVSLLNASSSYWLGKPENESLQRIYGISFPDKKKLKEYWLRQKREIID